MTLNQGPWKTLDQGAAQNEEPVLSNQLTANINVTGTIAANIEVSGLSASILVTGSLSANLVGIRQFAADITTTATVVAELKPKVQLTANITVTGDVTALLRKNIEYLDADITATGSVSAKLDVPWHVGNTLALTQTVGIELVANFTIEQDCIFQQNIDLVFGQRSFFVEQNFVFTQSINVIHVLPIKTASSTISFTQQISQQREIVSFLVLTQQASGVISFLEGFASSTLNLTGLAEVDGSIFTRSVVSLLNLTHTVDFDLVTETSVTNILDFNQNVFPVLLGPKTYILLQAPFNFIQTSTILPNPLLDDNENLVSNISLRRSMDNTPRTYVKTLKSRRLRYTFSLDRLKALELEAFLDSYNGADIKMLNWKGEVWKVKLITNPLDFVQTGRSEPGGDRTDVNLEFEGVLLNA